MQSWPKMFLIYAKSRIVLLGTFDLELRAKNENPTEGSTFSEERLAGLYLVQSPRSGSPAAFLSSRTVP